MPFPNSQIRPEFIAFEPRNLTGVGAPPYAAPGDASALREALLAAGGPPKALLNWAFRELDVAGVGAAFTLESAVSAAAVEFEAIAAPTPINRAYAPTRQPCRTLRARGGCACTCIIRQSPMCCHEPNRHRFAAHKVKATVMERSGTVRSGREQAGEVPVAEADRPYAEGPAAASWEPKHGTGG